MARAKRIPAARAVALYKGFREETPKRARAVIVDIPKLVIVMGYLDYLAYSTTINGKARRYKHKFAKGSKPMVCAGTRRNQLVLVGGRYHVTDRGIVDLSPNGRELED